MSRSAPTKPAPYQGSEKLLFFKGAVVPGAVPVLRPRASWGRQAGLSPPMAGSLPLLSPALSRVPKEILPMWLLSCSSAAAKGTAIKFVSVKHRLVQGPGGRGRLAHMANEGSVGSTHPQGRSWWVVDAEDRFRSAQMDPPSPSPHLLGKPRLRFWGPSPVNRNRHPTPQSVPHPCQEAPWPLPDNL